MAEEKYYKSVNNSEKIEMTPAEVKELLASRAEIEKNMWLMERQAAYGSLEEQLDMIYWDKKNGTKKWIERIDAIKAKFLKPKRVNAR